MNQILVSNRTLIAIGLWALASLAACTAHAVNFVVDTVQHRLGDDVVDGAYRISANTGSLRAAITQANNTSLSITVVAIFVPSGIYLLTRPPVGITDQRTAQRVSGLG